MFGGLNPALFNDLARDLLKGVIEEISVTGDKRTCSRTSIAISRSTDRPFERDLFALAAKDYTRRRLKEVIKGNLAAIGFALPTLEKRD